MNHRIRQWHVAFLCTLGVLQFWTTAGAAVTSEQAEFFEKQIRPVLAENCYRCHSSHAEKLKGGLLLDSHPALLKGGEGGAVIVPGHPEQSRLVDAIQYGNVDLQMPPKGKLSDKQIADFITWVKMGAPWPEASVPTAPGALGGAGTNTLRPNAFDLEARRRAHWCWQPIQQVPPPEIAGDAWSRGPVDRFILAQLERNGLHPNPSTEKASLLRRVTFDLIGLPPTPEELAEFLSDTSTDAYARVVDRLLASAHFGERWGRHWLDLVRYAETFGHEFDYPNPNAWRYRDYVIRAFNADVPYHQFVMEHIAGDLLAQPRRHPVEGFNESVIGTAFYWLGQRDHSPVDIRQHQAELIDNQIDVLTKTFLGLTVACARCHDHKFDAIPTQDYYSLYGILSSSRYCQAAIDNPKGIADIAQQLGNLKQQLRQVVGNAWLSQAKEAAEALLKSRKLWNKAVPDLSRESRESAGRQTASAAQTRNESPAPEVNVFADFQRYDTQAASWFCQGQAFAPGPAPRGDFVFGKPGKPVLQILEEPVMNSGIISKRLQGILCSPTFVISNRFIQVLAAGRETRINVRVENFTMIRDPIYGGLRTGLHSDQFRWITFDVGMWKGHRAYIELSDISVPDPAEEPQRKSYSPTGYLAVRQILFSETDHAPAVLPEADLGGVEAAGQTSGAGTLDGLEAVIRDAIRLWMTASPELTQPQAALLNWLLARDLLNVDACPAASHLATSYTQLEASIPDPVRVPAMADGTGLDEHVFVRGNHKLEGPCAPRRFLQAIAGADQPRIEQVSGRLQLAERMVAPADPLVARVMVNRVWLHLFGRGLVASPDNFGVLGDPPTHPELLDWLASWFRTDGAWSTKKLVRMLVTSSTYRMSSKPQDALAEERDPGNRLWHRMPVRRLEGEAIWDAMLCISGRMDEKMFGAPVPVHLTEFMDGRGRPGSSGPLDEAGRRSIYVEVRRNFVSPMMRTFDMPVPFTTVGRRTVSNVPAQSLFLMNDPFVVDQAQVWARRLLAENKSMEDRLQEMFLAAFGRPASAVEQEEALAFLREQATARGLAAENEQVWADLGHVLFNVKEFVFLN
jgi:hypothetical protein